MISNLSLSLLLTVSSAYTNRFASIAMTHSIAASKIKRGGLDDH
jgi:hypothetical protein